MANSAEPPKTNPWPVGDALTECRLPSVLDAVTITVVPLLA
jgi:hypothetical protein